MELDFFEPENVTVSVLYERIAKLEMELESSRRTCEKWKTLVTIFHDQIHKMVNEQGYRNVQN